MVYLEKGIQTPMAQGLSTKIISMIKWIRTSRLSIKNSLSLGCGVDHGVPHVRALNPHLLSSSLLSLQVLEGL